MTKGTDVSRVHCLDCAAEVVVDPRGYCPSGHQLGTSGARVAEAIGSDTPHPDEPEPWVGRIDPSEVEEAPTPEPRAPMPQSAPGLAPAAPPPPDTQDLFAELGALGDIDEPTFPPSTNGHGAPTPKAPTSDVASSAASDVEPPEVETTSWEAPAASAVAAEAAPEPWQAPQQPQTSTPAVAEAPEPWQAPQQPQTSTPAVAEAPEPWQALQQPQTSTPAVAEAPEPWQAPQQPLASAPPPSPVAPVRSVPAGGPEAREALSEISALEAAVRSLTEEPSAETDTEPIFGASQPPPPPATPPAPPAPTAAPSVPPYPAPSPDPEASPAAAFADVAALGFETAEPEAPRTGEPDPSAHAASAYDEPQAAGAEGQSTVGIDTMNFTAKGGRMRRSDQRKRRLFGR
jgi:hypothetical protein